MLPSHRHPHSFAERCVQGRLKEVRMQPVLHLYSLLLLGASEKAKLPPHHTTVCSLLLSLQAELFIPSHFCKVRRLLNNTGRRERLAAADYPKVGNQVFLHIFLLLPQATCWCSIHLDQNLQPRFNQVCARCETACSAHPHSPCVVSVHPHSACKGRCRVALIGTGWRTCCTSVAPKEPCTCFTHAPEFSVDCTY